MNLETKGKDPANLAGELMRDDELDQVIGGMYVDEGPRPKRKRLGKSCRSRPGKNKKSICVG